jgi:hypothetical protein
MNQNTWWEEKTNCKSRGKLVLTISHCSYNIMIQCQWPLCKRLEFSLKIMNLNRFIRIAGTSREWNRFLNWILRQIYCELILIKRRFLNYGEKWKEIPTHAPRSNLISINLCRKETEIFFSILRSAVKSSRFREWRRSLKTGDLSRTCWIPRIFTQRKGRC